MRHDASDQDVFTVEEIAAVARVPVEDAWQVVRQTCALVGDRHVAPVDAIRALRILRGDKPLTEEDRIPLTLAPDATRRAGRGLVASGALHVIGLVALLLAASLGLLSANDTDQEIKEPTPVKVVYLMAIGPGGGGGGGGLKAPLPPPPAARKAALVRKTSSPVPPVRRRPTPPPRPAPVRPPKPEPPKTEIPPLVVETKPPEPQTVKAPVVTVGADLVDAIGMLSARQPSPPSQGSGTGGGVGSGSGTGIGEGRGGGIGPGSGGGIGGGNFGEGAGISPPRLIREVRPNYTDEARRRTIEGDVELEIVVRRDGSVGNVRVRRTLGAGLEQKAIEAVRQWRFEPAKRQGSPVEVTVDVSVEFKLRLP